MYRFLFNVFLKRLDPEFAHHLGAWTLKAMFALRLIRPSSGEEVVVAGISFPNRIGMAAGFDKDAKLVRQLHALGFGHVEIGTVTAQAQPGNPRPRLFRIPEQRALINRMGFNNEGADAVAARLAALRASGAKLPVIGVNIGKTKVVELKDVAGDYRYSAEKLAPYADYLAVNVSSPNTPGLRELQQISSLRPILEAVVEKSGGKPVFVKIAPDVTNEEAIEIAQLSEQLGLAGIIATNTTITRDGIDSEVAKESGGLSGPVLAERSKELLKVLRNKLPKEMAIISVGGIETAAQVNERLELGADLVQGYTGFVYFGPLWAKSLTRA
ncbi:MAG: quinone-dependent dihydroorotate dehydrogenase [Candidatus Aquiluna sp.]|nr:quinone-dependent dihydroorotate dehydrogenase [Aquiluna sp.]